MTDFIGELGADCPTCTIPAAGTLYNIVPGSAMYNKPLREGGFSQMFDLSLDLPLAQFLTGSVTSITALYSLLLNNTLLYLGITYKVAHCDVSAGTAILTIHANSVNQKA